VPRGLFVTATDTNVGKTAVAAALLHRYRGRVPLRYWKPIQTGIEEDDDTAAVSRLADCAPAEIVAEGVRLPRPVSPHLAARWSNTSIAIEGLLAIARRAAAGGALIAEGAGGVLVPINDNETMSDLIAALSYPALVAARTALGTINHTLLTIEALRRRSIHVAGVVLVGPRDADVREAIEVFGRVDVLGEMPRFAALTADALAAWAPALDPAERLLEWLR
jgi:dethiobiotin synthase